MYVTELDACSSWIFDSKTDSS